jgi:hypothetical protein
MILRSKTLLLPSIVLLIGTIFGASATNASATIAFADDPFKNIGGIDHDILPVGISDKIRILPYPHSMMKN